MSRKRSKREIRAIKAKEYADSRTRKQAPPRYTHKKSKFVLYGTANGMRKKFGTYDTKKEAETAMGVYGIDLENSGFEENVKWSIEKKN